MNAPWGQILGPFCTGGERIELPEGVYQVVFGDGARSLVSVISRSVTRVRAENKQQKCTLCRFSILIRRKPSK